MPCNCGGKSKPQTWVYTAKDGTTREYSTEIQARAAVIRAGGGRITVKT